MKTAQNLPGIEDLLKALPETYSIADRELVQRAYRVAEEAHREQKRVSGEPYVTHCVAVAHILADLSVPPEVVAAGLLHDTVEDTSVTLDDIRLDTYRSSGAGGQHVNMTDSAVRITHFPTGIVVTCQNERSQTQNREFALRILRARLLEIKKAERDEEVAVLRGEYTKAEWGSQIRSYVLHPYQMVKDHRTEHETGNAAAVLEGELTEFMEAYLRMNTGSAK